MPVPISATTALARTAPAAGPAEGMCREPERVGAEAALSMASIFPPRDADSGARAAWLASSPWPEVVFASAH